MQDWNVLIRGVGPLASGVATDVESMTREFIDKLVAAGHEVRIATVTPGEFNLTPTAPNTSDSIDVPAEEA